MLLYCISMCSECSSQRSREANFRVMGRPDLRGGASDTSPSQNDNSLCIWSRYRVLTNTHTHFRTLSLIFHFT
jgi:hypothetical protein